MTAETLITVDAVSKRFCRRGDRALRYGMQDLLGDLLLRPPRDALRDGEFWALRDVNLTVRRGDVIGLIGHNGAGKSTLLKMLSGIYRPTLGSITVHTDKIAVLDHTAGLNPMQTGRESIYTKLALLGLQTLEIAERIENIVAMAELVDVIDAAVSTYSTGMRVRLAFAIYASVKVDVFIIDDSMGVADVRFAQRMQRYWQDFVNDGGTLLLASHETYLLRALCRQSLLFQQGRIIDAGDTDAVMQRYLIDNGILRPTPAAPSLPVPAQPAPDTSVAPNTVAASQPEPEGDDAGKARYRRFATQAGFPVTISAIELASEPHVGEDRACTHGRLTVTLRCVSSVAAARVLMGIEIHTPSGQVALHVMGGGETPGYSLELGPNVLSCTLEFLPLMPGRYTVGGGILDAQTKQVLGLRGWEGDGQNLEVMADTQNDLLGAIARGAQMTAPVRWHTAVSPETGRPEPLQTTDSLP